MTNETVKPQPSVENTEDVMMHEPDFTALPAKSALKKNPTIPPSSISFGAKVTLPSCSQSPVVEYDTNAISSGTNKGGDCKDDSTSSKKKHLTWDENAIEEHDLTRGTRMKIEEPNTPYAHYDSRGHSDDDSSHNPKTPPAESQKFGHNLAIHWDHLETKLGAVAAARDAYPSSPSACSSAHSDTEEEKKKKARRQFEFKNHRKKHYNEIEAWKKWKLEHPDGDTDDDDFDDDNDMDIRS